jgi:hypothetical protein
VAVLRSMRGQLLRLHDHSNFNGGVCIIAADLQRCKWASSNFYFAVLCRRCFP